MAVNGASILTSGEKIRIKEKHRIRKPMVEKMRRDRINFSINQLRRLLEQEFQLLQPDSKPEKADVLEIAVKLLRQQTSCLPNDNKPVLRRDSLEYSRGFSKCLRETVSFLSFHQIKAETQVKLLHHFHQSEAPRGVQSHPRRTLMSSPNQQKQELLPTSAKPLWRPW
ncbi:transcription factor HES-5-like [Spea bombifrons]|uniref:transcription factor HES-5-like n=1 Tax=Spea bombifrons TaxID=233779 RepID=UPI00234A5A14|nr:transcription factor HES-5-like [Spea bombifrons]